MQRGLGELENPAPEAESPLAGMRHAERPLKRCGTRLSVIIPTCNNAETLHQMLAALKAGEDIFSLAVVVVDAGSSDETLTIARSFGVNIINSSPDLGLRLEEGALLRDEGDWLFFLRPETRLPRNWVQAVQDFVHLPNAHRLAGYFGLQLGAEQGVKSVLLTLRAHLFGRPCPWQGLLLPRLFYNHLGGYRSNLARPEMNLLSRIGWARLEPIQAEVTLLDDRPLLDRFWHSYFAGFIGR